MLRVSVFGLGYVGCVSAACLADAGHHVIGVDVDAGRVEKVRNGRPPVSEPGLGALLKKVTGTGQLEASTDAGGAVRRSDIALVCVGTPADAGGRPNLDALKRASRDIGRALSGRGRAFTVVVRSTALPGTVENVVTPALREGAGGDSGARIQVAANPEFIRQGFALDDFTSPPITLVGCDSEEAVYDLRALYAAIDAPFVHTGVRTAEMVKYASSACHALQTCFTDELGNLCRVLGADAGEVMRVFRTDRSFNGPGGNLAPDLAFGASWLPKDLEALLFAAEQAGVSIPVLSALLPTHGVPAEAGGARESENRAIGIVGLSAHPGRNYLHHSPMVTLVGRLIREGCRVRILDADVSAGRVRPDDLEEIKRRIPGLADRLCESPEALLDHAEIVVVAAVSTQAVRVLETVRPDQQVIDLSGGMARHEIKAMEAA